ncbi:MAG: TlyA family RNA methyltransferase [bacterium]|nr:TlyA family RNA methyltransferase [bacterium]
MCSRLDLALVARDLVRSRNQGREFIRAGQVLVDGDICRKPSQSVNPQTHIAVKTEASRHRVGRGYDKLRTFLTKHPVDFSGRLVVDGGASTGGFTQIALEGGARSVLAVELGRDQLAAEIKLDPRVQSIEKFDIRNLTDLDADCDILLLDLSFVSLKEILPELRLPFAPDALLVALVKPQFELPSNKLTSAGRVRYAKDIDKALAGVFTCLPTCGWTVEHWAEVEPGPDQVNLEFLILAQRLAAGG